MILGRDIFIFLGTYIRFSKNTVFGSVVILKGHTVAVMDLNEYGFESLNKDIIKIQNNPLNTYTEDYSKS